MIDAVKLIPPPDSSRKYVVVMIYSLNTLIGRVDFDDPTRNPIQVKASENFQSSSFMLAKDNHIYFSIR